MNEVFSKYKHDYFSKNLLFKILWLEFYKIKMLKFFWLKGKFVEQEMKGKKLLQNPQKLFGTIISNFSFGSFSLCFFLCFPNLKK